MHRTNHRQTDLAILDVNSVLRIYPWVDVMMNKKYDVVLKAIHLPFPFAGHTGAEDRRFILEWNMGDNLIACAVTQLPYVALANVVTGAVQVISTMGMVLFLCFAYLG